MNPLLVTAFYDIRRGTWAGSARSFESYVDFFKRYQALLDVPRYCMCETDISGVLPIDHMDVLPLEKTLAYQRFFVEAERIMASPSFRNLFTPDDDARHVEHLFPLYNIVMLLKWDALERAARATNYRHSHYVWIDFGIGRRGDPSVFLPSPPPFRPIERDRIVLSANRTGALPDLLPETLTEQVRRFRDRVAGGFQIVPRDKIHEYSAMVRKNFEHLLGLELVTDDQLLIDMCVHQRPDFFHLSFPPPGISKFQHIDAIIAGTDKDHWYYKAPIFRRLGRTRRRTKFLARLQ